MEKSLLKRLQVVHVKKKDWKRTHTIYIAAYRALANPAIGVSPAKLLLGRNLRTKLPELSDVHVEQVDVTGTVNVRVRARPALTQGGVEYTQMYFLETRY